MLTILRNYLFHFVFLSIIYVAIITPQEEIHAVTQESLQVDKDQLEKEVRQLNKQSSQLQVFNCIPNFSISITTNYTGFASYQAVQYPS